MTPTIRTPSEGRTIAVAGDVYRFLATGKDTDEKYAIWEAIVSPGGGPPPHVHSRENECFYILEGEITLTVGGKRSVVTVGMFANLPVGSLHSFKNETDRQANGVIQRMSKGGDSAQPWGRFGVDNLNPPPAYPQRALRSVDRRS